MCLLSTSNYLCTVPSDFCLFDVVQLEFYGDICQNHSNLQCDDKIDIIDISFSIVSTY